MITRALLIPAVLAAALSVCRVAAAGDAAAFNPHSREGCLYCHKGGDKGSAPGRTTIFRSSDEPHAVVAGSCRSCHKDGKQDFWLVILPPSSERPAPGAPGSAAPVPPAARLSAPLPDAAAAAVGGGGEGFENSHDALDCASCHDKPAAELKAGAATPARFTSQGVEAFCRSCHAGVDRTHYPRGNVPLAGTTCLNCHRVHGRSLLFPSLRDDFPKVLADSVDLNPHGGKIFCLACHPDTPQPGAPVVLRFPGESLRLCQRCHTGVEHHPLGVKSTPATWKMDFSHTPLEKEAVVCISCHKPPECLGSTGRENPRFLRGGPYNTVEEFCARCHEGKNFSTLNPHDQIDESGEIYQKKCLYCHVVVPSTSAGGEGLRYTDTLTALCISCHQTGPHPNNMDHLKPLPKTMRENLSEYEERRKVRLPLEEDNRVTCITCHNPHERGLLKGPGGIGADEDKRLRLTTYNEQCTPCHGRH
jgi:predicted CXXCH cytochrome family protein